MKFGILMVAIVGFATPTLAQQPPPMPMAETAAAPAEPDSVPLYPDMKRPEISTENWVRFGPDLAVRNVTYPTITPFLPDPAKATGAAVVVAPGGAFMLLAWDLEGVATAKWLADHGIAAFLLKYRVMTTPSDEQEAAVFMGRKMAEAMKDPAGPPTIFEPRATEDGIAALKLVRVNAAKWGVDAKRVGMMGFSAGAMTTMNTALAATAADKPAFMGYIYGPMYPIEVPADAPPMFAAIAMDDGLFKAHGLALIDRWRKAGRPVELHAYERGDHGFGTGRPGTTTMGVMPQFREWLEMRGYLKANPKQ
jgi:acetyl esterase/lipase